MITPIFAEPGRGKTSLMTFLAGGHMIGETARNELRACKQEIEELNAGGFSLSCPPAKHVVFADWDITGKKYGLPPRKSFLVDGFKLGLYKKNYPTMFLPPYAQIYLDEAQKYYESRKKFLADFVSRFYEIHRHNHYNITLACQRTMLIDANIRELGDRFIYVEGMKNKKDRYGNVYYTEWHCIEFQDCRHMEKYLDTGKGTLYGKRIKFVYHGNIFDNYDSYGNKPVHYRGRTKQDFDYIVSKPTPKTVAGFNRYNKEHEYQAPWAFEKNGKPTKAEL